MKQELKSRAEVALLITRFYEQVKVDPVIGYIFKNVDWETHLPVIIDFWENTLFHTSVYKGNPMQVHQVLHQATPLEEAHFNRWVELFTGTVNELFEGATAELARQRALSIATMMKIKLLY